MPRNRTGGEGISDTVPYINQARQRVAITNMFHSYVGRHVGLKVMIDGMRWINGFGVRCQDRGTPPICFKMPAESQRPHGAAGRDRRKIVGDEKHLFHRMTTARTGKEMRLLRSRPLTTLSYDRHNALGGAPVPEWGGNRCATRGLQGLHGLGYDPIR